VQRFGAADKSFTPNLIGRVNAEFRNANYLLIQTEVEQQFGLRGYDGNDTLGDKHWNCRKLLILFG
jgi:hypothetical protein